jgi:protein SCO1/2
MLKAAALVTVLALLATGGPRLPLAQMVGLRSATDAARGPASRFPNVRLRTGDNREVRFYDDLVKGKLVLINFMFTTCTSLCPRGSANLARVQRLLGNRVGHDVFLVSISVDPDRDTPAVLAKYATRYGAGPGWVFATGTADDVTAIRQRLGDYDAEDQSPHTGMITYGNDKTGSWARMPITSSPTTIVSSVLRLVEGGGSGQ